jgi:hypothetical protein
MRIANIRLGHACNSSSTHSIVPLSAVGGRAHDNYDTGEFGWSHFMLASPGAKMEYLAATLAGHDDSPEYHAWIQSITGVAPMLSGFWGYYGYVDHQSRMALPVDGPYAELFLRDLAEYLKRDDVVILGGNDNDGRHPDIHLPIPLESAPPKMRPGTAPDGTRYWTVLDRGSGDRVRFSFHGQPLSGPGDEEYSIPAVEAEPLDIPYAAVPELVDLKVTNYCPFSKDCPWCYMDSTREGSHADPIAALAYLAAMAHAGVFEIALGGGEPTLWPHLEAFLTMAKQLEVNVNLTTKNIAWLKHPNTRNVRAVAVSINNRADLDRLRKVEMSYGRLGAVDDGYGWNTQITVQCVPAFCEDDLLRDLVEFAAESGLRITFLGVKRVGRAAEEKRADDLRWFEAVKPYLDDWWAQRGIAVDTLMATASEPLFRELGVSPIWYSTDEGTFSGYVDAVTHRFGASSYVSAREMVAYAPSDDFGETFREMQRHSGIRPKEDER